MCKVFQDIEDIFWDLYTETMPPARNIFTIGMTPYNIDLTMAHITDLWEMRDDLAVTFATERYDSIMSELIDLKYLVTPAIEWMIHPFSNVIVEIGLWFRDFGVVDTMVQDFLAEDSGDVMQFPLAEIEMVDLDEETIDTAWIDSEDEGDIVILSITRE